MNSESMMMFVKGKNIFVFPSVIQLKTNSNFLDYASVLIAYDILPMSKFLPLFFFVITSYAVAQPRQDNIVYSLYLIGDAGEPFVVNSSMGEVLRKTIQSSGTKSTVVYLGDNIYSKG